MSPAMASHKSCVNAILSNLVLLILSGWNFALDDDDDDDGDDDADV